MLSDNLSPNTLRPIFSHALSLKLETIKLGAFIQNYTAGQTVAGKVVQVFPEQKAVVEFQGEKLLLQFPRSVNPGQNIAIKIEQTHPSVLLKLLEISTSTSSQKIIPDKLTSESLPSHPQVSDKTSIQNRSADSLLRSPVSENNVMPGAKEGQTPLGGKGIALLSKTDLKGLGIEEGQKLKAEVLRIVDLETLQVRMNGNAVTIKHAAAQKLQPGDLVHLQAHSLSSGKFSLAIEQIPISSSPAQPILELSVLKNYLPARQPLMQVLAGLKEVFLDGSLSPLKDLGIDPGQLKQLQANLQKIVPHEFKSPDAVQLRDMVDRSGFNYEAKVKAFLSESRLSNINALLGNDLKGQLMRLARQLEQIPAAPTDNTHSDKFMGKLVSQVNQAVSNIELQQLTHHFSKDEHHPLLLQLPENLLGEEDRFKIYILSDQQGGNSSESDSPDRVFNLVFLLNLSALGDLRIETRMFKDEISIQIDGSDSAAIQFIEAHVSELEKVFEEEGFSISVTSRHLAEVMMEVPDSLGQLLVDTPLQMVDLKT